MKQQSAPDHETTEASRFSTYLICFSLLIYPATVLTIKGMNGLILVLLSIAGLLLSFRNKTFFSQPQRHETLVYVTSSLFFILAVILSYNSELDFAGAQKFAHLLLIIPVYIYIRENGIKQEYFWYGLIAGSLITMSLAWYEVLTLQKPRARSFTHPILFGDLAIAMGMMSLAGIGWFRAKASWQVLLPVLAVMAALISSNLAIARGSWAALPFVFVLFFWFYNQSLSNKQKSAIAILTTALVLIIYLIPQTQVQNQIDRTMNNIKIYNNSPIDSQLRATSIGARLEMWQASLKIFKENPITGIGWGNFQSQIQQQIDAGLRNKFIRQFSHPHNQFISALINGGIIAFLALLMLFYIPLKQLIVHSRKNDNPDINRLALAGLVLIISFIVFGLSEAIFERSRPINFYVFYLAIILGAISHLNNQLKKKSPPRKHSLSVTIITKNEEDRIEDCLQSVHPWADEIIIVDSGSDDNTLEIARQYTDKIYQTDWPGYGIQKQRALDKASCEWVLSIDADERLTPELRYDIDCILSQEKPEFNGYKTPWAVMLYGHRMDFGRSARAPLRLFIREGSQFTESTIHERVVLPEPQKQGKLEGRLLHYTHRDYGHGIRKASDYAWLSSQKYFDENRWGGGLIGASLRACWTFFLIYILRLGILDGAAGFVSAMNYAQNSFNKYAGLWSLRREEKLKH